MNVEALALVALRYCYPRQIAKLQNRNRHAYPPTQPSPAQFSPCDRNENLTAAARDDNHQRGATHAPSRPTPGQLRSNARARLRQCSTTTGIQNHRPHRCHAAASAGSPSQPIQFCLSAPPPAITLHPWNWDFLCVACVWFRLSTLFPQGSLRLEHADIPSSWQTQQPFPTRPASRHAGRSHRRRRRRSWGRNRRSCPDPDPKLEPELESEPPES